MFQKPFSLINACDQVTKGAIYMLVFLLPIFFLPWSSDVLDFNKQALLILVIFVAAFSWILKALISGTVTVSNNKVNIAVGVLFLVYLVSSLFSFFKYGSFWGLPQPASESLISLICFCLLYFLVSSDFGQKEVNKSLTLLAISALIIELYGMLQLVGFYIFPLNFAKSGAFNMVGSIGALGLFLASLLPLCIVLLISNRGWKRALYIANTVLIFILVLLINYNFIWWVVLVGSALIIIFWIIRREVFDGKWMFLPMFFLIMSLFFVTFHPQISRLSQWPVEIFLSQRATFEVAVKTLQQQPVLGSGPGTFSYDFLKHKNPVFNNSSFWNVQFELGSSRFLTGLATVGLFGFVALLIMAFLPLFYGIKKLIFEKSEQETKNMGILFAVLIALTAQTAGYFLYNSNMTLEFLYFFFIAIVVVLIFKDHKSYTLKPSALLTLLITFIFTLVFIFGIGFLVLESQRYVADMNYTQGTALLNSGQVDLALKKLEKAASANSVDFYSRQLSQIYLLQVQVVAKDPKISEADKTKKIQTLISGAVNFSRRATELNPNNVNNWSSRANIYQSFIGYLGEADSWAMKCYNEAMALDPVNPYLFLQRGAIFYQQKNYESAKTDLEFAINLKSDYPDVMYLLGLTYDKLGQQDEAINVFSKLYSSNIQNQEVKTILDNLRAGRPALSGLGQGSTTPIPAPVVTP